jgi:hypothetical protein
VSRAMFPISTSDEQHPGRLCEGGGFGGGAADREPGYDLLAV